MSEEHEENGFGIGMYIHKKTGAKYIVRHINATIEASMIRAVVYEHFDSGSIWICPYLDFFDGRFIRVGSDLKAGPRNEGSSGLITRAPKDWDGVKL